MTPLIQMRGISKQYNIGESVVHALKEINLVIQKGEFVSVWGPSGSGKTTLLNLIGAIDDPTAGQFLFDGNGNRFAFGQPERPNFEINPSDSFFNNSIWCRYFLHSKMSCFRFKFAGLPIQKQKTAHFNGLSRSIFPRTFNTDRTNCPEVNSSALPLHGRL